MIEDFERCYRAVASRDDRFDGWFFTAVTSTGIYCRPSCPAVTPRRRNIRFFPTAAAAQQHGFRACRRCRPDAAPGSPEWNTRADVVARAMRLIADGVVDREGVAGLARQLGYSDRHVNRLLLAEVGAGPLALARAQRAQTARILIETSDVPMAQLAFASGFASVRQFNDTVRAVFATTPSDLRRRVARNARTVGAPGVVSLRLAYRRPLEYPSVLSFLSARAVEGVEESSATSYRRTLYLNHGPGVVELRHVRDHVACRLTLQDLRDLGTAVNRVRRLLDLDADPVAVAGVLGGDPLLGRAVRGTPGLRVAGSVDAHEMAIRAVLGQQVSVAGARTLAGRLAARFGKPLTSPDGQLTHLFPEPAAVADADPSALGIPVARAAALRGLASAMADWRLRLDPGADWAAARSELLALPGIGPWTAEYVAMRALRDPDAFPATDLGLRKAAVRLGMAVADLPAASAHWRPWRAYAAEYLWTTLKGTA
ncbi:MAG: helix-turn-helix domain-containing protein [Nitriliruptorales bacterium]|nr:helix-turn-helix domain-containing protein [Nitriliruptorales bacterium]